MSTGHARSSRPQVQILCSLAPTLGRFSADMKEKEALARYFVSLICLDDLATWRSLSRPAVLHEDPLPCPPLGFENPSIPRTYCMANVSEEDDVSELLLGTKRSDIHSADRPERQETFILRLGSEKEESTAAEIALADGSDDATFSDSDSDADEQEWHASTAPADLPECPACLHKLQELESIETDLIPKAKREMRALFASRAEKEGMRVALEEVLFREEGLEVYSEVQGKLDALADEVERLTSGYLEEGEEEKHECLGPRKKRSSAVVQDE